MNASDPMAGLADLSSLAGTISIEGTLPDRMGIRIVEASPDRVVGIMPVEGNTQPYGLLHGGASCVLAETLGSVGAAMHAMRLHGGITVGVDINATHHKGVRNGNVTGVATPVKLGGSVATYEIVITDEGGDRVCTARLTCLLRRPSPNGDNGQ
jgi:1,4-dihydroxy-2-naphthoyl-CoA hydrolase